jgi:hypothetical protein
MINISQNNENVNNNFKIVNKNKNNKDEGVFCPITMKKDNCELANNSERFCNKNIKDKINCAKIFRENGYNNKVNIYDLIPHESFLYHFVKYCNNMTDAPDSFGYATGLVILSTVVQRNIFIFWTGRKLYANLYVLLIAKSGGRKGTTLGLAKQLLNKLEENNTDNFLVFPDDITPESLFSLTQNQTHGTFFHGEFGGFLKGLDRSYNKGLKELLTDIFDNFSHKKFIKGKEGTGEMFELVEPAINILGASTVAWLSENLKESDFKSGFMQRFVFFPGELDKKEIALPVKSITSINDDIIDNLYSMLSEISGISGEIVLSKDAIQAYESFYYSDEEFKKRQSEVYGSFHTRLYTFVIKLSMLYCAMRMDKTISKEDIEYGIKAKLLVETQLYSVFDRLLSNDVQDRLEKIKNIIAENGGIIDRSKLLRYSHMLAKDFDNYIMTLEENGTIFKKTETKTNKTKPTIHYCLVDA